MAEEIIINQEVAINEKITTTFDEFTEECKVAAVIEMDKKLVFAFEVVKYYFTAVNLSSLRSGEKITKNTCAIKDASDDFVAVVIAICHLLNSSPKQQNHFNLLFLCVHWIAS